MRRFAIAFVTAVSMIALTQIASATPYNWTGFYVGANVGGGWGTTNIDYVANDPGSTTFFRHGGTPNVSSVKTSGALGGVQLGYNWQFAPIWVAGLEADFDWSGIKGSGVGNFTVAGFSFSSTAEERVKWFSTARARLGYLPANNLLAYVTGGFAYGRVDHSAAYLNTSGTVVAATMLCPANSTCLAGSSNTTAGGWTAGGGFEYAIAPKWTVKAEYLYVSLAGNSVTETQTTSTSSINANFGRTKFNVAWAGVNYRF